MHYLGQSYLVEVSADYFQSDEAPLILVEDQWPIYHHLINCYKTGPGPSARKNTTIIRNLMETIRGVSYALFTAQKNCLL